MRWSVGIEADGGQVLSREQVVGLADAVAASSGVATGIGTSRYGARLVVQAASREQAIKRATAEFTRAAAAAGLPQGPIVTVLAVSEEEEEGVAAGQEEGVAAGREGGAAAGQGKGTAAGREDTGA